MEQAFITSGLILCFVALSYGQNCRIDSFKVMENFDLDKYMGKWYEISWTPGKNYSKADVFSNYQHNYKKKNDNTVDGVIRYTAIDTGNECQKRDVFFTLTSAQAKFNYTRGTNPTITTPFWILDTDYENYALTYGCINITDGECDFSGRKGADFWIWSRKNTIADEFAGKIEAARKAVCMQNIPLWNTTHELDCSEKEGNNETSGAGIQLLSIILVIGSTITMLL